MYSLPTATCRRQPALLALLLLQFGSSHAFVPISTAPSSPALVRPARRSEKKKNALVAMRERSSSSSSSDSKSSSNHGNGSKNSDRAHIERELENMMDNDWRVFRAKLVAQERQQAADEQQHQQHRRHNSKDNNDVGEKKHYAAEGGRQSGTKKDAEHGDKQLARQGQLGDLFAGAISSIFKGGNQHGSDTKHGSDSKKRKKSDIFDGTSVGGLLSSAEDMDFEDPFVSEAELPLYLGQGKNKGSSKSVVIDKHRWAHEIPHIEPGCVLLANEKLGGVFHQTVVLIIDHHEKTGSTGVVINRCVTRNTSRLYSFLTIAYENSYLFPCRLILRFP